MSQTLYSFACHKNYKQMNIKKTQMQETESSIGGFTAALFLGALMTEERRMWVSPRQLFSDICWSRSHTSTTSGTLLAYQTGALNKTSAATRDTLNQTSAATKTEAYVENLFVPSTRILKICKTLIITL